MSTSDSAPLDSAQDVAARGASSMRWFGVPTYTDAAGRSVPFAAERPFQLLAFLACRRRWVTRDELAALFWPERGDAAARANLRKVLLLAQRVIVDAPIETRHDTLRWQPDSDLRRFDAAIESGRHAEALQLSQPPLMQGLDTGLATEGAAWLEFERKRAADGWRRAAAARLAEVAPLPAEAAALAETLLAVDAFDETALLAFGAACLALGQIARGLRAIESYAQRLADAYDIEPPAPVRQLRDRLVDAGRGAGATGPARPAPLPATADGDDSAAGFIGRRFELAQLLLFLERDGCRLVTIIGAGGTGKSRFARIAAQRLASRVPPPRCLRVALEDVADAGAAATRFAVAVGLEPSAAGDVWAEIAGCLGATATVLFVDNAEHLAQQGLAAALDRLLGAAPLLRVVVTSRVRLGVAGEYLLPLDGLPLPDVDETDPAVLDRNDAVRLFVARAQASLPSFDLAATSASVVRLVHAVDGMPLALELAAAWVRLLPLDELAAEIERSLDLLDGNRSHAATLARDRSLRACFDRSWHLLGASERVALAALARLPGAFGREMAEQVAACPLPLLAALVDKSLLRAEGNGRFSLHPLLRQFSLEHGAHLIDGEALDRRHAAFMTEWLARVGDLGVAALRTSNDALARELVHARAAWRWSVERRRPEIVESGAWVLGRLFESRGWFADGTELIGAAAAAFDGADPRQARAALASHATLAFLQVRSVATEQAAASAAAALAIARRLQDREWIKEAVNLSGLANANLGRLAEAKASFEEALAYAREDGDDSRLAPILSNLGTVEGNLRHYDAAIDCYAETALVARHSGNVRMLAAAVNNMATVHLARFDGAAALACATEALALYAQAGLVSKRPIALINAALAHEVLGAPAAAASVFAEALAEGREMDEPNTVAEAALGSARLIVDHRPEELAKARSLIAEAIARAMVLGWPDLLIKCILTQAALWLRDGAIERGRRWGDWAARHALVESVEQERWLKRVGTLPGPATDGAAWADDAPLAEVMARLARELAVDLPASHRRVSPAAGHDSG